MPLSSQRQRKRLQHRAVPLLIAAVVALVFGVIKGVKYVPPQQRLAQRFFRAWEHKDYAQIRDYLDQEHRERMSANAVRKAYEQSAATATLRSVQVGKVKLVDGKAQALVRAQTRMFGVIEGKVTLQFVSENDHPYVKWDNSLTFPGLQTTESLRRTTELGTRGNILARNGEPLASGPNRASSLAIASSIVGELGSIPQEQAKTFADHGYPATARVGVSGLERALEFTLAGTPGGTLFGGERILARSAPKAGKNVRTSIIPSLQQTAVSALAGRLGGVIALKPRTGEILAASGVGFSGTQPPGSTFKIITLTAALQAKITTPSTTYPVVSSATLEGVELENANRELCGGTLVNSFAESCNSVFGPLGAKLGAQRLVAAAERFGFNQPVGIPGAATPTIPAGNEVGDDLAVGSTAIGQGKVQATALTMARVAAAIANQGRLPQVTLKATNTTAPTSVATSPRVAQQVKRMMLAVVKSGTGVSAAISGIPVAGKTGTAELHSTQECTPQQQETDPESCSKGPEDTTAWFTAFAPAGRPRIVVCVMLVGAGAGGDTAAPAARSVLQAALQTQ